MRNGPKCPNHGVLLTDCQKGQGICPVSGAIFGYQEDEANRKKQLRINALGQMEKTEDWEVVHIAGQDH